MSSKPVSLNSARQLGTIKESHRKQLEQTSIGGANRPGAIVDKHEKGRSASRVDRGRERAKEHEGSWYGFRIGGLLALPALDDVFKPTFLDDQLNRRRKSPLERSLPPTLPFSLSLSVQASVSQLHLTLIRNNDREAVTRDPAKWPV